MRTIMRLALVFSVSTMLTLLSCGDDKLIPDVSDIDVDVTTIRTEAQVSALDTSNTLQSLQKLFEQDSSFYDLYFRYVLRVPLERLTDEKRERFINGFVGDERIRRITQEVDSVYGDFSGQEEEFEQAFRYMKYYFPEKKVPQLYTYISEYSLQRFLFEKEDGSEGLALGLDMFLGENYPYSARVNNNSSFSDYLVRRYNKEHLVKRGMEAMVEDWLGSGSSGATLLDKMIYHGKKLYILEQLLPRTPASIIMEYTEDQLDWCQQNEQEMWAFFFKEELFYSTDINKITKLVNPSPDSPGMPAEAPGRTANYMGWQIVKAFMARNPEVKLSDLITFESSQKILEKSKFKPKRK